MNLYFTPILDPFQEATDKLQALYETLCNVIPSYFDLLNKRSLTSEEEDKTVINNTKYSLDGKHFCCEDFAEAFKLSHNLIIL
jgi:hypothetical protein